MEKWKIMKNQPFVDPFPVKNGDFQIFHATDYQMVRVSPVQARESRWGLKVARMVQLLLLAF